MRQLFKWVQAILSLGCWQSREKYIKITKWNSTGKIQDSLHFKNILNVKPASHFHREVTFHLAVEYHLSGGGGTRASARCGAIPARYSWTHLFPFLDLPSVRGAGQVWGYSQVPSWVPLCWSLPQGMRGSPRCDFELLRERLWLLFILMHQTVVQITRPSWCLWVTS